MSKFKIEHFTMRKVKKWTLRQQRKKWEAMPPETRLAALKDFLENRKRTSKKTPKRG